MLGTERNNQRRSARQPQLYSFPFSSIIILPLSSLHKHCPSPRPPAQDNCECIEDLPAFTAFVPTPFPTFEHQAATIDSNRDSATLVYPAYSVSQPSVCHPSQDAFLAPSFSFLPSRSCHPSDEYPRPSEPLPCAPDCCPDADLGPLSRFLTCQSRSARTHLRVQSVLQ